MRRLFGSVIWNGGLELSKYLLVSCVIKLIVDRSGKEKGEKEDILNYSISSSAIVYREQTGYADGELAKGESILLFGKRQGPKHCDLFKHARK